MLAPIFLVITSLATTTAFMNIGNLGHSGPPPDTEAAFGIPFKDWHCGHNDFFRSAAVSAVNASCPLVATDFNHCCAVHDDCYSAQAGRSDCDYDFCHCLRDIRRGHPGVGECGKQSERICELVKDYGEAAYIAGKGRPYNPPPVAERRVTGVKQIADKYPKLYDVCPFQAITFSSCALNFDICIAGEEKRCVLDLARCLEDTQLHRKRNDACDRAVDEVIAELFISGTESGLESGTGTAGTAGAAGGDNVLVSVNVYKTDLHQYNMFQRVWRRMPQRPMSPWLTYVLVIATFIFLLLCIIALFYQCDREEAAVIVPVAATVPVSVPVSVQTSRSMESQSSSKSG